MFWDKQKKILKDGRGVFKEDHKEKGERGRKKIVRKVKGQE